MSILSSLRSRIWLVLVLCLLGGGVWLLGLHLRTLAAHARDARLLQQQLAALRASGLPTTAAQAQPVAVPEDQNAAPLYEAVFGLKAGDKFPNRGNGGLQRLKLPDDLAINLTSALKVRPLLESAAVRQALARLRAASLKPYCVLPIHWGEKPPGMAEADFMPYLGQFRQATRLLAVEALLQAHDGHLPQALDWLAVSYRMADQLAQTPDLIAQLVAYAMYSISDVATRQVVCPAELSPQLTRPLFNQLRNNRLQSSYEAAMRMELANGLDMFGTIRKHPTALKQLVTTDADKSETAKVGSPDLEEANYIRYMLVLVKQAGLPYREIAGSSALKIPDKEGTTFAQLFIPPDVKASLPRDRCLANVGLLQTVLALKAYHHDHGHYPDSLSALTWKIPTDPFSGKSFVYHREGAGFKLYSVGPDLVDNGGLKRAGPSTMWKGDMIVSCDK